MLLTTDNVVRAKQPKTTKAPLRNMYIVIQPMSVTYMHAYPFTQETCMHTCVSIYSRILEMTPAPTVLPPSRSANFIPCKICNKDAWEAIHHAQFTVSHVLYVIC